MEVGQLIGNYKVVRKIGAGGMGEVYEALHQQIGSRAAIKVLLPNHSQNADMLNRFFNEARAVNIVQHAGLVRIFECGRLPDGAAYIVMEYLEGESLRARLRRQGGRLDGSSLLIARQIASALAATHAKKIIHRDLKPDNFMLVPDSEMPTGERIKILDFGIAKLAADAAGDGADSNLVDDGGVVRTRTGLILGTPAYMAPEQCRGLGHVDEKADVYSLGVILFEMLSGRTPFKSPGFGEMAAMHMFMPPPDLAELVPGIRPDVAQLVARLLSKKPAERPSMADVAAELERLYANRRRESHPSMVAVAAVAGGAATGARAQTPGPQPVVSVNSQSGRLIDQDAVLAMTASGDLALTPIEGEPVHSTLRESTGQSGQSGQRSMVRVPRRVIIPALGVLVVLLATGAGLIWRLSSHGPAGSGGGPSSGHASGIPAGSAPGPGGGKAAGPDAAPSRPAGEGSVGTQAVGSDDGSGGDKGAAGTRALSGRAAQLVRTGREKLGAGDLDGALSAIKKANEAEPGHPDVLVAWADVAMSKKDYATAVKQLKAAQKVHRLAVPQATQLAQAQYEQGSYQDALETCAKALKRSPDSAELIRLQAKISGKLSATPHKNAGYERIED